MVQKEIVRAGNEQATFVSNTKVVFHFRTFRVGGDGKIGDLLDDTRHIGNGPFELIIGRSFKLKIWEELVRGMLVNEVARFTCEPQVVREYPIVSKALRDIAEKRRTGKEIHQHTCGHAAMATGYDDLDKLTMDKPPLMFEIEIIRVEQPDEYKQDSWQMSDEQKRDAIPKLRQVGNELYRDHKHSEAAEKYYEALSYLEQLSIKEKPQSEGWNKIEQEKLPLLLNYAQCKMASHDYWDVIRHTSSALEIDGNSVKAYYRRAKAHAACWNVEEAKKDFQQAVTLDPSLTKHVSKELTELQEKVQEQNKLESERLRGKKLF